MSEYGADTIARLHAIDDVLFTEEFQTRYLEVCSRAFDLIGSVVGQHVWNFADFATLRTVSGGSTAAKRAFLRGIGAQRPQRIS